MASMFPNDSRSGGNLVDVTTEDDRTEDAGTETAADTGTPDDGLVSRLAVIEDQPLESRAAAYSQLLDQLQGRLEGGDVPRSTNG